MRDRRPRGWCSFARRTAVARLAAIAVALLGVVGHAEESWGHHGSLGLTVAGGAEFLTAVAVTQGGLNEDDGIRAPVEVAGTLSITEHTELRVAGRLAPPGPQLAWSVYAGIRNARGERFKTFFDLDLAAHIAPVWTLGLRLGLGVQYELLPVLGVFAVAGVQGGGGGELRLSFELLLGLQFRTYLFQ